MSATRDEVLQKMAVAVIDKATDGEGFADSWEIPGDHPTMVVMANEMASAALAAAEQAGWRLVPVEADEAAERLREAVGELERAWSFHDRVMASPPDERSAVGQDHYNWCERAARNAIRALQP